MKTSLPQRRSLLAAPAGRRRRAGVALAALLTVAGYGLGNLSGLVHLAVARHVICVDHGAVVHADHGHGEAATPSVPADVPALTGLHAISADAHEHCGVGDHLRRDGLAARPAEVARAAPAIPADAVVPASRAHAPIRPLRFAPKHSPPAAA